MSRRARLSAAGAALSLLAVLSPVGARADHCGQQVIVFSTNSNVNRAVNSNAVTCDVVQHDADTRLINPGSDIVTIRWVFSGDGTCQLADPATGTPAETRQGTLDGLGNDNKPITLTCHYDATPNLEFYSFRTLKADGTSEWFSIDPTAVGCITATVVEDLPDPDEDIIYPGSFHTVGGSCPDF